MLTQNIGKNNDQPSVGRPNIITHQSVSKHQQDTLNETSSQREKDGLVSFLTEDNYSDIIEILQLIAQISEKMGKFVTIETLTEKYDELYTHIQNVTVANAKLEDRVAELEKKNGG